MLFFLYWQSFFLGLIIRLLNLPRLLLTCNINLSDKFFSLNIVTRKKKEIPKNEKHKDSHFKD